MVDSIAAKSASSFSKMEVMAGVSWDGSITENLGRPDCSRKGLVAVAAEASAVRVSADMLMAVVDDEQVVVVVDEEDEAAMLTVLRARRLEAWPLQPRVDERMLAALEKAREGEFRETMRVKASAEGEIFIINKRSTIYYLLVDRVHYLWERERLRFCAECERFFREASVEREEAKSPGESSFPP
jgi:hypothetical protein